MSFRDQVSVSVALGVSKSGANRRLAQSRTIVGVSLAAGAESSSNLLISAVFSICTSNLANSPEAQHHSGTPLSGEY